VNSSHDRREKKGDWRRGKKEEGKDSRKRGEMK